MQGRLSDAYFAQIPAFHGTLWQSPKQCLDMLSPGISPNIYQGMARNDMGQTDPSTPPADEDEFPKAKRPAPKDGTIKVDKRVYQPPLSSDYVKPDLGPDMLDGMEVLYKEFGSSLRKQVKELDPRDDIIEFNIEVHTTELKKNLKWHECPEEHKPAIKEIITDFWDVFCEEGMQRNIRSFTFCLDTGDVKPIQCKPP